MISIEETALRGSDCLLGWNIRGKATFEHAKDIIEENSSVGPQCTSVSGSLGPICAIDQRTLDTFDTRQPAGTPAGEIFWPLGTSHAPTNAGVIHTIFLRNQTTSLPFEEKP